MTEEEFILAIVSKAQQFRYRVERNRKGQIQIDFGHKKLHEGHLKALYPRILEDGVDIGKLIEAVAPGRPCTHRPMKGIMADIKNGNSS
jgi:hypothetical protein